MSDQTSKTVSVYNKIAQKYADIISSRLPIKNLKKFTDYLPKNAKILDIGCAAGRDCFYFYKKNFYITGIDLSESLLNIAKKQYPYIKFILGDIRKLPFKDDFFDGLWASAVFHHLDKKDMLPTLQEWRRVLKKNSMLYLSTKKGKSLWQGKDSLSIGENRQFTLLSRKELEKMLEKTGFSKISIDIEKDLTRDILWISALYKKL